MKAITILLSAAMLAACNDADKLTVDRCERQKLFDNCLVKIPKGPDATVYNDWAEVVDECSRAAARMSRVIPASKEPETCETP